MTKDLRLRFTMGISLFVATLFAAMVLFAPTASAANALLVESQYKGLDWMVTTAGETTDAGLLKATLVFGNGESQIYSQDEAAAEGDVYWLDWIHDNGGTCVITAIQFDGKVEWANPKDQFAGFEYVETIDLNGLDIAGATDTSGMFWECKALKTLDLSGLDTSKVTNMGGMFQACESLESVNFSVLDASNVENMNAIFWGCKALKSMSLSGMDLGKVVDMDNAFEGCKSMKTFDFTDVNIASVKKMYKLFYGCGALKTITVSKGFALPEGCDTSNMFYDCTSLVGGNGTKFDENKIDGTYACIDKTGQPGYFTMKLESIAKAKVALKAASAAYTGEAQKGAVKSVTLNGVTLAASDYTVSAKSGKKAGTYAVTVTGVKDSGYTGSATANFKITKAANSATAKKTSVKKTYKAKALKKALKKIALPKVTTKFGTAKWVVAKQNAKSAKVLKLKGKQIYVKKGAKAGTYTVKLKAQVAGTANYKAAKTKAVTVKVVVK